MFLLLKILKKSKCKGKNLLIIYNIRTLIDEDEDTEISEVRLNKDLLKGERVVNNNKEMASSSNKQPSSQPNFFDPFSSSVETNQNTNQTNTNTGGAFASGLEDIFGTKSLSNNNDAFNMFDMTGNNNSNTSNNNSSPFDNNIFGSSTPSTSTTTNNNTNSNMNFDMFGNTSNTVSTPQVNSGKQVFNNNELKISCVVNHESDSQMSINYFASNLTSSQLTNIKMTFLAPKTVTVKVVQTSGANLEANQENGIKKDLSVTNNDLNKKVVLKLKISYFIDGKEVNENVTLNEFN